LALAAVRAARASFRAGRTTLAEYERAIAAHIGFAVGAQEALGLDVLVHGEAERTDMVEFFGQELEVGVLTVWRQYLCVSLPWTLQMLFLKGFQPCIKVHSRGGKVVI
jgi:Cobalamin-independent synthase, Catalytic domain